MGFGLAKVIIPPSPAVPFAVRNDILEAIQRHEGVFWFNNNWLPAGMVGNLVSGSGTFYWADTYLSFYTGATALSYAAAYKSAEGLTRSFSWGKRRIFSVDAYLITITLQVFHIVSGYISSFTAIANTAEHIGFKLDGANVYGTVADGTTEATLLLETLTAAVIQTLTVELTPGIEARFWIDGVDKGAITTNLPTGTSRASILFYGSAYNAEAVGKEFRTRELRIFQEE